MRKDYRIFRNEILWSFCVIKKSKIDFEKSRKKVLTNTGTGDNIMKLSERDSKKHKFSIERLKKVKKVVDKLQKQCYDTKVAAENKTTAKNLDN